MISWWMFWRNLRSLLARRRAYRRKLPNRPVIKPVIGGVIDEQRKLAIVLEIIDDTHWRGVWNGQVYECRSFPDTDSLTVGDAVVVHAMPNSTELWNSYRPGGDTVELWFSPGYVPDAASRAELWRLTIDTNTDAITPEHVWTCPNDDESITHLCWSKVDDELYVFTFKWVPGAGDSVCIYRVDREAGTVALVVEQALTGGTWSEGVYTPYNIDAIIDTAQYLDNIYCCAGSYYEFGPIVWVFNPSAGTLTYVWQDTSDGGTGRGYGSGMATDSGNGRLFASNGCDVWVSSDGTTFALDADLTALFNSSDSCAMLTSLEAGVDQCFHGFEYNSAGDPGVMIRDNVADSWSGDLFDPTYSLSTVTFTNLYNPDNGALIAAFSMEWGWYWGDPIVGQIYRKDPGGLWTVDGRLPWENDVYAYQSLGTQSLAQANGKLFILVWCVNYPDGYPGTPGGHHHHTHLYRRDSAGTYTKVWDSDREMEFFPTHVNCTGMALTPGTATPVMMRCHEV